MPKQVIQYTATAMYHKTDVEIDPYTSWTAIMAVDHDDALRQFGAMEARYIAESGSVRVLGSLELETWEAFTERVMAY